MPPIIEIPSATPVSACATRVMRRCAEALLCLSLIVGGAGCQMFSNPYHDDLANRQAVTTASVDGARAATIAEREAASPLGDVKEMRAKDGTVTHGPLYFEDGVDENGSDDGQFTWTHEDGWQILSWRARFLMNVVALPIHAVMTPPWQMMASDGRPSREVFGTMYDAVLWDGS